jgi:hypothetical protein
VKCEQDFVTAPSVKRTLMIESGCEKLFKILYITISDKITQNSISPPFTLDLKIYKIATHHEIALIKGFPRGPRA